MTVPEEPAEEAPEAEAPAEVEEKADVEVVETPAEEKKEETKE